MHIERLHVVRIAHPWKTRVYVVLVTDTQVMGIGEATLGQLSRAVVGALRDIEASVIGLDPHDVELLRQRILRDIYADGGQVISAALAGIEMACWDIVARVAREPLFNVFGGRTQPRMRVYANGWYRERLDAASIGRLAREVVAKGYTALKIDPFGASWRTISREGLDRSMELLAGVRSAIGPEADLIVEGHARFDAGTACHVAQRLEPLHPLWFEEPVPYTDLQGYRRVAAQARVPIAAGESLWRVSQFTELLATGVSVVQFDPIHVGGLSAARTIAHLALEHNTLIAPHSASGPVNELACAHLATAYPHAVLLERFQDFEVEHDGDAAIRSSLKVADGMAELELVPGLGAGFALQELLALHTEETRHDQNVFRAEWEMRRSG